MEGPGVGAALETAVVPFEFEGSAVRVIHIDGAPWFVAADVCSVLGLKNSRDAVEKLDEDEKRVGSTDTSTGAKDVWLVSEAGYYKLSIRCRKATTPGTVQHRFCKWVTGTVLPQIRRTGSYQAAPAEVPDLTNPEVLQRLLLTQCTKRIEAEKRADVAEATVATTQPKADVYDLIANADGLYNITTAAKLLNQSPNKFMQYLRAGYLYQRGSAPVPRQEYIDRGIFTLKVHMIDDKARSQSLLTPKGLAYFAKKLGVEIQRELFPKGVTA